MSDKRAVQLVIGVVMLVWTAMAFAAGCPELNLSALDGWETALESGDVIPYRIFGLQSSMLCSARSPSGSFVFVTRVDSGERPPLSCDDLEEMISPANFEAWNPLDFLKRRLTVSAGGTQIPALLVSMVYPQPGHGKMRYRKVYIPLLAACGDGAEREFRNYLYVVHYWGEAANVKDLRAFQSVTEGIRLAPGCSILSAGEFEEQRRLLSQAKRLAMALSGRTGEHDPGNLSQGSGTHSQGGTVVSGPEKTGERAARKRGVEKFLRLVERQGNDREATNLLRIAGEWKGSVIGSAAEYLFETRRQEQARSIVVDLLKGLDDSPENRTLVESFLVAAVDADDSRIMGSAAKWLQSHQVTFCSLDGRTRRRVSGGLDRLVPASGELGEFLAVPNDFTGVRSCLGGFGFTVVRGEGILDEGRLKLKPVPPGARPGRTVIVGHQAVYSLVRVSGRRGYVRKIVSLLDLVR